MNVVHHHCICCASQPLTEFSSHIVAAGRCNETGWNSVLTDSTTGDFNFTVKKSGDISPLVITPFAVTSEISDTLKSISVEDDHGKYQVQVNGIDIGGSGENTPGKWVKSGK